MDNPSVVAIPSIAWDKWPIHLQYQIDSITTPAIQLRSTKGY